MHPRFSPLLDAPLEGPIYLRSNGGERELPDVVADLRGQVRFILVGFVDAVHKKGSEQSRIRTTFATVPDAPVSKAIISLNAGKKKGLLVNSANICKTPNQAIVKMKAQNGKEHNTKPRVATGGKRSSGAAVSWRVGRAPIGRLADSAGKFSAQSVGHIRS